MNRISELKELVLKGHKISMDEAIELASFQGKEELYNAADEIRKHFCGERFELCSIINAKSGSCSENCKWCSQSVYHDTGVSSYDSIAPGEAVEMALHNEKKGVKRFSLVTSGRGLSESGIDTMIGIYDEIKKASPISLCASMGLIEAVSFVKLKNAGVTRYHCNLETSKSYFPEVCTTHTFDEKLKAIKEAGEAGLSICSGGIIGMGETMAQRIELAIELGNLGVLSIPLNVLNPIKGTELENMQPPDMDEILTTIALFRFINPRAVIRFAGGRKSLRPFQERALRAGINGAIVGDMLTTTGSSSIDEDREFFKSAGFNTD
ncbi:MAG TPA: biotin synthase BioB [Spirochaetota bacterium]|nr:biotin synthase BioB [Spirochaetota bacterium]